LHNLAAPPLCRLITPTPPDPRREALPVRMSMVGVERALEQLAAAQEAEQRSDGAEEAAAEARERLGLYAYRLAVVSGREAGRAGRASPSWPAGPVPAGWALCCAVLRQAEGSACSCASTTCFRR
jgi:hypothetical protein